ncbi:MAG: hypothetical protein Q7T82_19840 [Armatimonadota bacterium]|nr:hypothetical protein [Armatimonadota bacterium]
MKSFRPIYIPALIAAVVLLAALAGCHNDRISIARILENPDRYMDREVTVAGEVTKAYTAPLFIAEPGVYQIDDGTGLIWVITKHGAPRVGSEVGLKGIVSSPIRILGDHFGAVIREDRRKSR